LLTREKFYEEADYVWRRTGTGPQSSGHGCVRDNRYYLVSLYRNMGPSEVCITNCIKSNLRSEIKCRESEFDP